jgi:hypothetical protein
MDQSASESVVAGVKVSALVAAFLGAAITLSSSPPTTMRHAVVSAVSGTIVGAAGAPLVLHYLGLAETLERPVSFFCGLVALKFVPVLLTWVDRARNLEIPKLPKSPDDKDTAP